MTSFATCLKTCGSGFEILTTIREAGTRLFSRDYQRAVTTVQALSSEIDTVNDQVTAGKDDLKLSQLRYEGSEALALEVVTA